MDLYSSNAEIFKSDTRNSDDRDSMSDIYQTEENAESCTNGPYSDTRPKENRLNSLDASERKRRATGLLPLEEPQSSKRARLDGSADQEAEGFFRNARQDMALRLPAEIWQHIFTFVPPRTLGSLMMVNKQFNTYLDPSSTAELVDTPSCSTPSVLSKLKSDTIWQASRRLFWPRMPAALKGRTELEMWRICCSPTCQFCKFRGQQNAHYSDSRRGIGPGSKGVAPVFPFSIVSCGRCLEEKSVKEIDLLLNSSILSTLLAGLPKVFLTPEIHVIPPRVLASDPLETPPVKVFWHEHVENIKAEFEATKAFGSAAAEEWVKGLEAEGKHSLADASRWERWFLSGGVDEMRRTALNEPVQTLSKGKDLVTAWITAPKYMAEATNRLTDPKPTIKVINYHGEDQHSSQLISQAVKSESHMELTIEEVESLKATRRAEIEQRASIIQPRIPLKVLAHMPAFQEALRLTTPLDDDAWQTLRPLLLTQRRDAEKKAKDDQVGFHPFVDMAASSDLDNPKVTDADWHQAQGPLRARISAIADKLIQGRWKGGRIVTEKNAAQFAAQVLLHVRKKFYAEIRKDAKTAKMSKTKPFGGPREAPWTRKLTLENMKWIFEMKIKPHTFSLCKQVFLCNGCPGSSKWYGFDGLVQHYACKHSMALSLGNATVHWRAEWPKTPIYKPSPQKSAMLPAKTEKRSSFRSLLHDPGWFSEVGHGSETAPQPMSELGTYTSFPGMNTPMNYGFGKDHQEQYFSLDRPYKQDYSPYTHPSQHDPTPSGVEPYSNYPCSSNGITQSADCGHYKTKPGANFSNTLAQKPVERLNCVVKIVKQTWKKIGYVKKLQMSVKVCAVIHHIAKKFQEEYFEPAPLDLFITATSSYHAMRDACSGSCLACKACQLSSDPALKSMKYSLLGLLNHFNSIHSDRTKHAPLDWRVDMIWLPDISTLMKLRDIIGRKKEVLDVLSDTLPWAFEAPRCGPEHLQDGYRYDASDQVSNSKWQQPTNMTSEAIRNGNQRSAAPRLELDGFEIVERPKQAIHYKRHDDRQAGPPQYNTPATPSNRFNYTASSYQHHYPQAAEMSGRHDHQWNNVREKSHNYAHTPPQQGAHSYESQPVETYEIVEVRDPNGDYLIRRPIRREPSRETRYETQHQPYSSYSTQYRDGSGGAHVHGVNTTRVVDYEEYNPRFPAGGDTRYTR